MKKLQQLLLKTWQKHIIPFLKIAWSKYHRHIAPFVVFGIAIGISLCILKIDSTKITLSLSILGSGFAIFQFWVSELNTNQRRRYDLRFIAIKEFNNGCRELIETYNTFIAQKLIDGNSLKLQAINKSNRIMSNFKISIDVFFPEVKSYETLVSFYTVIDNIINVSKEYSDYFNELESKDPVNNIDIEIAVKEWKSKIKTFIVDFYENENKIYEILKNKL